MTSMAITSVVCNYVQGEPDIRQGQLNATAGAFFLPSKVKEDRFPKYLAERSLRR